jgi:hypothetical protein
MGESIRRLMVWLSLQKEGVNWQPQLILSFWLNAYKQFEIHLGRRLGACCNCFSCLSHCRCMPGGKVLKINFDNN